jgi:DNA-binding transcriptional MerR regulator
MQQRLEVEDTTEDELRQQIERSAKQAVEAGLREMRETIDRIVKNAYLQKTWLTLEEAARYAGITPTTLRSWRNNGLPEAEVEGRIYIKREEIDSFIGSHEA